MGLQYDLRGKTAVITGAARGLGLAFAESLASARSNIAALDISPNPSPALVELALLYDVKVKYYVVDIASAREVDTTISLVERDFGSIDITINAAGVVTDEPFLTTTGSNLEKTFLVNFTGSFLVAQRCAQSMARRYEQQHGSAAAANPTTGSIIFITSIATHTPSSAQRISAYIASKAAVRGLVKPLAMELAPYGIRVNSLSPGYTMTDMMKGLRDKSPDLVRQFEKETLFGRIGTPEELKGPILWLACDKASGWYTGQDLLVDGGATTWKHPAVLG